MIIHKCYNCKHFLFESEGEGEIEVICPNCRTINYCGRDNMAIGPRGMSFKIAAVDLRCPECNAMLGRATGNQVIKGKCRYCKTLFTYSTIDMRNGTVQSRLRRTSEKGR